MSPTTYSSPFTTPTARKAGFTLIEAITPDDFERAVFAGEGAREPHLAIAALADAAQELIIGDIHKPETVCPKIRLKNWSQIPDLNG